MGSSLLPTRRLAAVWFADVVGYSRLTEEDEGRALALVAAFQTACTSVVERAGGRLVRFIGDGALAEFTSTEMAARAAVALHEEFAAQAEWVGASAQLRIGIHVGEVIYTPDGDVYGGSVNTAARLQTEAEPGQTLVSGEVGLHLRRVPAFHLEVLGERTLKGIEDPVRVLSVEMADGEGDSAPLLPFEPWTHLDDTREEAEYRSVAVLPFVNRSSDPENEYFSDGITEELLNALVRVPDLKVAARTSSFSFKGRDEDVRRIGEQLGVSAVIEGSVRKAGSRLRVTAELVGTRDGYHIWSQQYDRDLHDVFALQDELARTIVDELRVRLGPRHEGGLVKRYTDNLHAYDLYLRGRHQLHNVTADGLVAAMDFFERAIAEDPQMAPAWAALASACVAVGFFGGGRFRPKDLWSRAQTAATEALRLDDALADAHGALGTTKWACDWDFDGAELALRHAVELRPGDALLNNWHAWALLLLGRANDALLALERARDLDPLSPWMHRSVVRALILDRQYERAEQECRASLDRFPDYHLLHSDLAAVLLARGHAEAALAPLARSRALNPTDPRAISLTGYIRARLGDREEALRCEAELRRQAEERHVGGVEFAIIWTALHDHDAAFAALRSAHEARDPWLPWVRCNALLDDLRSDPRYHELLDGMR